MDTGYETTSEDGDLPDDERVIITVVRHALRHLRLKDMTDDLEIGQKSNMFFFFEKKKYENMVTGYVELTFDFEFVSLRSKYLFSRPTPPSVPCPALTAS